jgi:rod shape determining protein RodA
LWQLSGQAIHDQREHEKDAAMKDRPRTQDFDWALLAIVAAISTVGVLEIYSSTHAAPNMAGLQWKQLTWIGIGVVGMFLISRIDYHTLMDQAPALYMFGLATLLVVLAIGHSRFGARRWVPLIGGFNLQVSELMKLIIIIVLARFFAEVRTDRLTLTDLVKVAVLTGVPVGLILIQPDLGTAMVLVPVAVVGAFLAGIEWKHLAVGAVLVALMIPVGWNMRRHLKPYQQQRIETFLHPEENPRGAGYQILQSEIAVGSGGFWGKGFGKGSQNQLGFVPVRYSDFILAALAEEQGFIGVCVVLLLYLGLILRLVDNAQKAKDRAGMFVVMGVTAILGFHVLVNASMVIGYMPVTGIPLPLMSYGGSSTAFVFLALGLVMNVRMRRFVN